jgi:hypothetical protein
MFSRGKYATRWDLENATSLCYGCHRFLDTHPDLKAEFFQDLLGADRFDALMLRSNRTKASDVNAAPHRHERLPHPAKLRRELAVLLALTEKLQTAAIQFEEDYTRAYESSLSQQSGDGIGRGFASAPDPTGETATNAQLRHLRWSVAKAARCWRSALSKTEEGLSVLGDGMLLLDDAEFGRWVAKRLAAEG